jgi:hypothetical protein
MRKTPSLTIGAALIVALLNNGLAIAQPASTGEAVVDTVGTRAGQGMNFALGTGVGAAPDYEGSDDYELTPPQRPSWNRFLAITNTC